ncbi:MAG: sensor histidine kinase [Spirochaetales bacterium]|nr:sensor histidine kinase [Spirochaetales bacterium]
MGLTIALGSIGSAALTGMYRITVYGDSILEAIRDIDVWFTSIWIPVGFFTAFSSHKAARVVQTYACLFFACVGSFTARQNELTSMVFLGIGLALGLAYGIFNQKPLLKIGPVALIYFIGLIISVYRWTDRAAVFILLWFTGAGMVCVMYWTIGKAAWQEIKSRKAHLEEQIRLRTEALETSLREAESLRDRNAMLLKELHHRTKNSLQIVASLLSIQQGETQDSRKSVGDILNEAERRVRTMAKTHEMFHQHDGVSVVGIELFVRAIIEGYLRSGLITSLFVETDAVEHVAVEMDTAIPLGLIINELFSNVVQHAYAQDLTDRPVWVFLSYREGTLIVTIEDHGIGIPESVKTDAPKSGGLRIVRALAGQIDAELLLRRNPFTTWIIRTPLVADIESDDVEA